MNFICGALIPGCLVEKLHVHFVVKSCQFQLNNIIKVFMFIFIFFNRSKYKIKETLLLIYLVDIKKDLCKIFTRKKIGRLIWNLILRFHIYVKLFITLAHFYFLFFSIVLYIFYFSQ